MTEQEPEHICSIFERCVFAIQNNLKSVSDCPTDCMFHLIRTRPYTASPTQDTTGQEKPDCEGKCCPSGIVQGKEVLCRAESYMCEYQCPIDGAIPKLVCTRDSVEQDEREKVNKIFDHTRALCDAIIERFDCQSKLGFNALIIKRDIESLRACSAVCRGGVR